VGIVTIIRLEEIIIAEAITIKRVSECALEAEILFVIKAPLELIDFTFF
jgi:hypothetical protein